MVFYLYGFSNYTYCPIFEISYVWIYRNRCSETVLHAAPVMMYGLLFNLQFNVTLFWHCSLCFLTDVSVVAVWQAGSTTSMVIFTCALGIMLLIFLWALNIVSILYFFSLLVVPFTYG